MVVFVREVVADSPPVKAADAVTATKSSSAVANIADLKSAATRRLTFYWSDGDYIHGVVTETMSDAVNFLISSRVIDLGLSIQSTSVKRYPQA